MKLDFLPLDKLAVSKANMRYAKRPPDVSDILPTVRARGVLVPLIVRANGAPDAFEIVAGSRRFHAARIVADETGQAEPLPCAILDAGDDAAAIEASLIENLARLDPDEVTQWETFTRLVREGRTVDDIAATFGLPDLAVRRVLALGNLLPRIRAMYAREEIDRATVRHLTLASKSQQRAWLALADDAQAYLPTGHQLKAWLFGGQSIAAKHALFDLDAYAGATVADLFGDDRYFADPDTFWTAQNAAIEARRAAYLEEGWSDVVIVPASEHFHAWEYEKTAKRKGGRVYVDVRSTGEVTFHEGYLTRKDAQRARRADTARRFVELARENGLLSVLEPVVRGTDASNPAGFDREAAIVEAAAELAPLGCDLYKCEVPTHGRGEPARAPSAACAPTKASTSCNVGACARSGCDSASSNAEWPTPG